MSGINVTYFDSFEAENAKYKLNEIINKLLLGGDKFVPEMHLRQPGFMYSACEPFFKNKKKTQKFNETGDSRYKNR